MTRATGPQAGDNRGLSLISRAPSQPSNPCSINGADRQECGPCLWSRRTVKPVVFPRSALVGWRYLPRGQRSHTRNATRPLYKRETALSPRVNLRPMSGQRDPPAPSDLPTSIRRLVCPGVDRSSLRPAASHSVPPCHCFTPPAHQFTRHVVSCVSSARLDRKSVV